MTDPKLRDEALTAAAMARRAGITQESISLAVGASQSQVSRILSGHVQRRSRLFEQICKYVFSATRGVSRASVQQNQELIDALASTWDGTPEHATALATVIRTLGTLHPTPYRRSE